tara:strand:- start:1396 stop:1611 length:216 start_codon:yes stop_codon:yes gene_type:complete
MKQGTQKHRLYNYLKDGNKISTFNAMYDLGIADLQGVIRDLKKEGVEINSEYKQVQTRFGGTATVKEYRLV